MPHREERLLHHARDFFTDKEFCPVFTKLEQELLRPFFTSTDGRVYFIHSLPETVIDVLVSMFSRIKNARGLRGIFVDSFLPLFFASTLPEVEKTFNGETEKFLRFYGIDSMEKFVAYSETARCAVRRFQDAMHIDPEYIAEFSSAPKVRTFLQAYLDKYGHNSIARMGKLTLCLEQISILAAKSVEWGRMGTGYVELSTRYVNMSGKGVYPIWRELEEYGVNSALAEDVISKSFGYYTTLQGENFSGLFPNFLRERYKNYKGVKGFENGIVGETCDVLGNFLPCATLTSLGVAVSGEAYPELLKHLILDGTPENMALVELIMEEAKKIGGDQFSRHYEPTEWKRESWEYLNPGSFSLGSPFLALRESTIMRSFFPPNEYAKLMLAEGFRRQMNFQIHYNMFDDILLKLSFIPRGEYDKLPNHFETIAGVFTGMMSFRSWRDLQRQQLCTHYRSHVSPFLGFYKYDKPAPEEFFSACRQIWIENQRLYYAMRARDVPHALCQYPLAMGNIIGFEIAGNLAQMEFCIWQRSDFSVNHEVRQMFLKMERELRERYPWWHKVSRADTTPAYVFARSVEGISLVV